MYKLQLPLGPHFEQEVIVLEPQKLREEAKEARAVPKIKKISGNFPWGNKKAKTKEQQVEMWCSLDKEYRQQVEECSLITMLSPYLYGNIFLPTGYMRLANECGIIELKEQLHTDWITKDQLPKNQLSDLQICFVEMIQRVHNEVTHIFENTFNLLRQMDFLKSLEDHHEITTGAAMSEVNPSVIEAIATEARSEEIFHRLTEVAESVVQRYPAEVCEHLSFTTQTTIMGLIAIYHVVKSVYLITGEGRDIVLEMEERQKESPAMLKFKEKGNKLFNKNDYEGAIEVYTKAISRNYYNSVLYCNRCQAAIKTKNFKLAVSDGFRALILKPTYGKAYYRQAEAYKLLDNIEFALRINQLGLDKCSDPRDKKDLERQRVNLASFDPDIEARINFKLSNKRIKKRLKKKKNKKKATEDVTDIVLEEPPPLMSDESISSFSDDECKFITKKKDNKPLNFYTPNNSNSKPSRASYKKTTERHLQKKKILKALPKPQTETESEAKKEKTSTSKPERVRQNSYKEPEVNLVSDIEQIKINFSSVIKRGSMALIGEKYHNAVADYDAALKIMHDNKEIAEGSTPMYRSVLIYSRGVASIRTNQPSEISRSIDFFERIKISSENFFHPMVFYTLAKAYYLLNSFSKAEPILRSGFKFGKKANFGGVLTWPEIDTPIPESKLENLTVLMQQLLLNLKHPPKPYAVCRYEHCLKEHNRRTIYLTDLNFEGYLKTICSWKCRTCFHFKCWNKFKHEYYKKMGEKEILGLQCFTDGCKGIIIQNLMYDDSGEVKREIIWENEIIENIESRNILLSKCLMIKSDRNYKARLFKMKMAKEKKKAAKSAKKIAKQEIEKKNIKTEVINNVKEITEIDLKNAKIIRKGSNENVNNPKSPRNKTKSKIKKRTISLNQFIGESYHEGQENNEYEEQNIKEKEIVENNSNSENENNLNPTELKLVKLLYEYFESVFKEYGPIEIYSEDLSKPLLDLPPEMHRLIEEKYGGLPNFFDHKKDIFCEVNDYVGLKTQYAEMLSFYQNNNNPQHKEEENNQQRSSDLDSNSREILSNFEITKQTHNYEIKFNVNISPTSSTSQDSNMTSQGSNMTSQGSDMTTERSDVISQGSNVTSQQSSVTPNGSNMTSQESNVTSKGLYEMPQLEIMRPLNCNMTSQSSSPLTSLQIESVSPEDDSDSCFRSSYSNSSQEEQSGEEQLGKEQLEEEFEEEVVLEENSWEESEDKYYKSESEEEEDDQYNEEVEVEDLKAGGEPGAISVIEKEEVQQLNQQTQTETKFDQNVITKQRLETEEKLKMIQKEYEDKMLQQKQHSMTQILNLKKDILELQRIHAHDVKDFATSSQILHGEIQKLSQEKFTWGNAMNHLKMKAKESQDRASEVTNQLAFQQNMYKDQAVTIHDLTTKLNQQKLAYDGELKVANNKVDEFKQRAIESEIKTLKTQKYFGILKLNGAKKECERFVLDFDKCIFHSANSSKLLLHELGQGRQQWKNNAEQCALLVTQVQETFKKYKEKIESGIPIKELGLINVPNPPSPGPNIQQIMLNARRSQMSQPVLPITPFSNEINSGFKSPINSMFGDFPKSMEHSITPKSPQPPIGSEKFKNNNGLNNVSVNSGVSIANNGLNNGSIVSNNNGLNNGANNAQIFNANNGVINNENNELINETINITNAYKNGVNNNGDNANNVFNNGEAHLVNTETKGFINKNNGNAVNINTVYNNNGDYANNGNNNGANNVVYTNAKSKLNNNVEPKNNVNNNGVQPKDVNSEKFEDKHLKNNASNNADSHSKKNHVATVRTPTPTKPLGSFERIMNQLQALFTNVPRKDLALCIKEVRQNNNNSLTGLSNDDIVNRASHFVSKKGLIKKYPNIMTPSNVGSRATNSPTSSSSPWTKKGNQSRGGELEDEEECVICQDPLKFKKVHKLLCNHVFHQDCLGKWLEQNRTCPTCRDYAIDTSQYPALSRMNITR